MKIAALIIIIFFISACTDSAEIKNSDAEINDASIRTTKIEINGDVKNPEKPNPMIDIVYPKDGQSINGSNITIELSTNFAIDGKKEMYFAVWLDSEKKVINKNKIFFYNVFPGKHSITAELLDSNYSSLNPKVIKTITVNVETEIVSQEVMKEASLSEYTIEADDYGFYPDLIHAKIGNNVVINFNFRDSLIYFAGLDVYGPFPDIKYRLKDEQPITRNFTMSEETIIKSFWPSSGVKKGELVVEVEE